jgi:hypothetical protein
VDLDTLLGWTVFAAAAAYLAYCIVRVALSTDEDARR